MVSDIISRSSDFKLCLYAIWRVWPVARISNEFNISAATKTKLYPRMCRYQLSHYIFRISETTKNENKEILHYRKRKCDTVNMQRNILVSWKHAIKHWSHFASEFFYRDNSQVQIRQSEKEKWSKKSILDSNAEKKAPRRRIQINEGSAMLLFRNSIFQFIVHNGGNKWSTRN